MTTIEILRNNGNIIGFKSFGHSGYSEEGSDIVCAAVSMATGMAAKGIIEVLKLAADFQVNEKKAGMKLMLSKKLSHEEIDKAQVIFNTLIVSLEELEKDYKKFVKLEARNEIY